MEATSSTDEDVREFDRVKSRSLPPGNKVSIPRSPRLGAADDNTHLSYAPSEQYRVIEY